MCVKFDTDVPKVRFKCRSGDTIKADVTETCC